MAVARFNLAFRFDHESNDAWQTCAVARLLRDSQGGWRLDPDFVPPMAMFSASQVLRERLVLLNRQLRSRRLRLMAMRRESNDRIPSSLGTDFLPLSPLRSDDNGIG
jgi:type VI secretion system protein ImpJ